jgi:hypothetical protein
VAIRQVIRSMLNTSIAGLGAALLTRAFGSASIDAPGVPKVTKQG